jgi:Xaa-Pro aminopeptidase
VPHVLVEEKVKQAIEILKEYSIDCWVTFVRESSMLRDPMLNFLSHSDFTWHSALIITREGGTYAIVGELERKSVEDLGVYKHIEGYVESVKMPLLKTLKEIDPASIALNYSQNSEIADGITHGMFLTFKDYLSELQFQDRIISSEKIVSSLRARKTGTEISRMKRAIGHTQEIFDLVGSYVRPGRSEQEIADFMKAEVAARGLTMAWDEAHCPAVFTGPDTAGAHYRPTTRKVEKGHVLNMDFGVRVEGYCSDLQRTFYLLEDGETSAPKEVQRGFQTIVTAIERARRALRTGTQGREVDAVARQYIVSQGYEEYPHGLGHQVGQFAHDGTALLGPEWEKYASRPFEPIETGMVFTLEPRLTVPGKGIVTIEEMVIVEEDGAAFLSQPQLELYLR